MELDQATASDPCKQACPMTTGWSGRPESCYGSDALRSKRVPVACPIGRQTEGTHGRSRQSEPGARAGTGQLSATRQATDLLSRRSATDRQQIAPDPPCRSKCSNCTERIPSGSSAVSTRPPCSVSVPPEARNQRKMPTTSHRLQTSQAQGRRHEPCSAACTSDNTQIYEGHQIGNHRSVSGWVTRPDGRVDLL